MLFPSNKEWRFIEGLYSKPIHNKGLIIMNKDWTRYQDDPLVDRTTNNKKAIEHYIYIYILDINISDEPVESMKTRARILVNLGNRYLDRYSIEGNRHDDIRLAICAYKLALAAFTRDINPSDWANAKMNIGAAYGKNIYGNPIENVEKSIEAFQQSLEKISHEKEPKDWANVLMNLGTAYTHRVKGDRANNILKAIEYLRQSWFVWKRRVHPHRWAIVMMNFGNAHLLRNINNKSKSIEIAIRSYNQALKELKREECPDDWSLIKTNLGNAYSGRIKGNPEENIELAIKAYRDALEVRTQESTPIDWALTTANLGNIYIKGGFIKEALTAFNSALSIITPEKMPLEWAKIKAALGRAYSQNSKGFEAEIMKVSVEEYKKALTVFHPDTFPFFCRAIAHELGDLCFNNKQWSESAKIYKIAVQADENLYLTSVLEINKEAELEETGNLYRRLGYSLAKSSQLTEAVVYLERGRARVLGEALTRDREDLDDVKSVNPELYYEYIEASRVMRNLDAIISAQEIKSVSVNELLSRAEEAHANLSEVVSSVRCISGYENFLKEADWNDLIEAVLDEQPLIYLLSTSNGGLALIIYRLNNSGENGEVIIKSLLLEEFTDQYLDSLLNRSTQEKGVFGFYVSYHLWKENGIDIRNWLASLLWVTEELWKKVMGPIISFLQSILHSALSVHPVIIFAFST